MSSSATTTPTAGEITITLVVHHLRYISGRKAWEYDDVHLQTLCDPCHTAVSPGWLADRLMDQASLHYSNLWTMTVLQLLTMHRHEAQYVSYRFGLYECSKDAKNLAKLYESHTPEEIAADETIDYRARWLNEFCVENAAKNPRLRLCAPPTAHATAWLFTTYAAESVGNFTTEMESFGV